MPRRISGKVNAFYDKLFEHPGRIFPGLDLDVDIKNLQEFLIGKLFSGYRSQYNSFLVEFGSGSGGHIIELAKMKPNTLCLGFEIRFKRAVRTIEKAIKENINNVYIFRGRSELAREILRLPDIIIDSEDGIVDEVYINFPDPWEKKRQRKHRILSKNLFVVLDSIMRTGGLIAVKTDHKEYFESFLSDLGLLGVGDKLTGQKKHNFIIEELVHDLHMNIETLNEISSEARVRTEFEKLFIQQGLPIFYLKMRAIAKSD
ncbi:MAG TPA: hypothetical protein PJ989_05170 [Oligoflexia bacterium]|nr:hypothetical protein [Oligoflexia bacterium]